MAVLVFYPLDKYIVPTQRKIPITGRTGWPLIIMPKFKIFLVSI